MGDKKNSDNYVSNSPEFSDGQFRKQRDVINRIAHKRGIFNRKGEMTSTQLITLILTIAGFVVVLLFILAFKSGSYTEDEICKLSVLTRATSPTALNTYVQLKCTTKKVCLSDGSGKCESALAGENPEVIKLPSGDAAAAKKIEEISANAMYDCWNMMGQGKLDLFNGGIGTATGVTSQNAVSCVICSRIAFNASEAVVNNVNIDSYLRKNKVPGSSLTYLQSFTDAGVSSYAAVDSDVMKNIENIAKTEKISNTNFGDVNDNNQKVGQLAVVFAQIKPGSYGGNLEKLANTGIAITAASFLMAPATTTSIATKAIGTIPGLVLTGIGVGGVALYSMSNVYAGKVAAAGYCGKITGTAIKEKAGWVQTVQNWFESETIGCSGVQIVPYDVKAINKICQSIEGSP